MNDSIAARLYYERYLHVPKSRKQRLLRPLRILAAPFVRRNPPDDALGQLLWEVVGETFGEGSPTESRGHKSRGQTSSSVVLDDVDQDGRRRLLAFIFEHGARTPFAIAKAQSDLRNGSLRSEAEGLRRVHAVMPEALRTSVPEVLRMHAQENEEVLVISAMRGRSAYLDMRASLRPSRFIDGHFAAASRWLAAFHEATGATHGDFWPHNLLIDGDDVSVVDWENFTPDSSSFVDLFHFPLTYGLSYRYADPETSFARTFLEANPLSRAVKTYLADYASRRGMDMPALTTAFDEFLATKGTMGKGEPHPGTRALPWERFREMNAGFRESRPSP